MSDAARPLDPAELLAEADWARRLARALVGSTHGDDVAQEALRIALERRPAVEGGGVRAWLGGVIANLARKQRERGAAREHHERRAARGVERDGEPDAIERVEFQKRLVDAVLALDEPYRSAIALRYFDDLDPREVARRQGISYDAARQRIARGVALLRARFEREEARGGRAWNAIALSLANVDGGAPIALGTGGIVMGVKMKLAACAVVLAVGGVVLWSASAESGATSPGTTAIAAAKHVELAQPNSTSSIDAPAVDDARSALATAIADADPSSIDVDRDLHGIVVDEVDRPIAGVSIEVRRNVQRGFDTLDTSGEQGTVVVATATTSADGTFAVRLDDGRAYDLVASAAGRGTRRMSPCHAGERVRIEFEPSAQVSGRVTRRADGTPVLDAEVILVLRPDSTDTMGDGPSRTRTDDDGRFRFDDVVANNYWVQVHPRADAPPIWGMVDVRPGDRIEHDVVVDRGQLLRGRVVDALTGGPVVDAEVGEGWAFRRSVRTDGDGRFAFEGFALEGVYEVAVRARGYGGARKQVREPNAPFPASMEIAMMPGRAVEGRVVDGDGRPVADASVTAVGYEMAGEMDWVSARTGADGRFRLEPLNAGLRHAVVARKDGHATWQRQLPAAELATRVYDVGDVVLAPPASIRGVVVGEDGAPAARHVVVLKGLGADYRALEQDDSGMAHIYLDTRRTSADDRGRFSFADVAAGKYEVDAELADRRRSATVPVEVVVGASVRDVRVVVDRGVVVAGRVVGEDGRGVRAYVEFESTGQKRPLAVQTDAEGRFDVPGLADIAYDVVAKPEDLWRPAADGTRHAVTTVPGVRGGTRDLTIVVPIAIALTGRVVDTAGEPVAQQEVQARGLDLVGTLRAWTNPSGEFTFWVAPGARYEVSAWSSDEHARGPTVRGGDAGIEIRTR